MWGLRGTSASACTCSPMFPTHVGIARRLDLPARAGGNVPYACGDCADAHEQEVAALLCSLRMWGLRGRSARLVRAPGMFPTHVGIARLYSTALCYNADVPYACGDCAYASTSRASDVSCSLRMWGLRVRVHVQGVRRVMFPTHVGIARRPVPSRRLPRDVPYACGDCATCVRAPLFDAECSLRMWGLREWTLDVDGAFVMFPTHVGIARRRERPSAMRRNVPYACGDCAAMSSVGRRVKGCSLRMWGLRGHYETVAEHAAMFPTHVGIARQEAYPPRQPRDVPYACGDCACARRSARGPPACSLRMWGLRGPRV